MSIFKIHSNTIKFSLLLYIFCTCTIHVFSQSAKGLLKGRIVDGSTYQPLFGVEVKEELSAKFATSSPDGSYLFKINKGSKKVSFKIKGFQTKVITDIKINNETATYLNIILFPVAENPSAKINGKSNTPDSINNADTLLIRNFTQEVKSIIYFPFENKSGSENTISSKNIQPGTDKDAATLIKRLNGVVVKESNALGNPSALIINGLGERYNQVMLNGAILNSVDPVSRTYAFNLFPIEMIEKVSVQKISDAAVPADFAGGSISIKTTDFPDRNFLYIQAGGGFNSATAGKDFLADKGNNGQFFSFPGSLRDLPASFPTTRSMYALKEKNIQDQIYHSQQLKNNLAPVNNGRSKPNDKLLFGFGRAIKFKHGERIGITGFFSQQKTERIDESTVQVSPNVSANPFPFDDPSKILIRSQSENISYTYSSQMSAAINGTILFGKNKISLKTLYGSQFINALTQRSKVLKLDEDQTARVGINYKTEQRKFINVQLSGEHSLGANSKLKMDWFASYFYYRQQNPDERNFLLRQDSVDDKKYEIGHQAGVANDITNSGRLWRDYTDHNFTGAFNLTFPFDMYNRPQLLSGGISIQTKYRVFFSDLLLMKGTGYHSLENILAPERYYPGPGGLSAVNYFTNHPFYQDLNDRGNYTGTANLGAAYIRLENKITNQLDLNWGIRVESNSQLISSFQYNYFEGYRYPQISTIDQNITVNTFNVLPTVKLKYELLKNLDLHAAWFRTVNRPQLQEQSLYRYYDANAFMIKTGNQLLKSTYIENIDIGFNWIANAKSNISITGFYKKIDQPIENILSNYSASTIISTPYNTPPATAKGITASFNLKMDALAHSSVLSGINLFASGTWCETKAEAGPLKSTSIPNTAEHTLSGSPAYSFNGGFLFDYAKLPQLTILYNYTSDYITAVGSGAAISLSNGNKISAVPDYRVKAFGQMDIQLSQKLFHSNFQIIAGVNNLLNNYYTEYQDLNGNKKFDEALSVTNQNVSSGYYRSGVDNRTIQTKTQRNFYLTISYLFK